jgi:eukaryotic-like serine/threonine-protein kinase
MPAVSQPLPSRYTNVEQIATGGMGEIYLAHDDVLGRKVAIKLLAERFARDVSIRRRFTREALAAAKLSGHPNIVTIFDVGEADEGRPFIVMEYLAGGTLADRARRGPVGRDAALEWLREAGDALDEAHRQGIIHRDVKPANLLLNDRGTLKVADFGIARVVDETATGMTMAGTVLGTAGYLSPEQARGEPTAAASDIYGLGVVAYELLTGGRPFEGGSATSEAAAHIHQPVPPASERGVGLPVQVDAVFDRVLAKDPARRYTTARDFVRALCLALEAAEDTKVAAPFAAATAATRRLEGEPLFSPGKRRRPWVPMLVALGLAAAALAGVIAAATMGGDDDPGTAAPPTTQAEGGPTEVTITQEGEATTVVRTVTTNPPPPTPPPSPEPAPPPATPPASGGSLSLGQAIELTDQATFRMRDGDYAGALPLAQRALARLQGTGHTYEGYANYNVGKSLASLGRCEEALPYLDRREQLLGESSEVDAARRQCGAG